MQTQNKNEKFDWGEPVNVYTSENATEDGILVETKIFEKRITNLNKLPFSHVTVNLLTTCGYMTETEKDGVKFNIPCLIDLFVQAYKIGARGTKGDWFYSGKIELPSGKKQEIFIAQNETGKFTIMLPEDY